MLCKPPGAAEAPTSLVHQAQRDIAEEMDAVGGALNAFTSKE